MFEACHFSSQLSELRGSGLVSLADCPVIEPVGWDVVVAAVVASVLGNAGIVVVDVVAAAAVVAAEAVAGVVAGVGALLHSSCRCLLWKHFLPLPQRQWQ